MARILVVDDEPAGRILLAKRLRPHGHEILEAGTGTEALAAIEREKPDLVLLDARMPPPDGFEVCREVKRRLGDAFLPIIMVTALDEEDSAAARLAGADDFLRKAFRPEDLLARVNVQLRTLKYYRALQEANARLEALATTDGLTGLLNHRRLQERLAEEAARAERQGQPLAAVMIDIDKFKSLNDSRGHKFGDEVLKRTAATIRRSLREIDVLGRYGGEEFGALLIETTKEEAKEAGERIRRAVAAAPVEVEGHEAVPVSVSIGVAAFGDDVDDPHRLFAAADTALYAAKRNGRNRVEHLERRTFRYRPPNGGAASVALAGDFNGWSKTSHPLTRGDDGTWTIETIVPTGRQRYKFFLNGERFVPDPAAEITEMDSLQEPVSVLVV